MTTDTDKLREELQEEPYLHRSKVLSLLDELDRLRAEKVSPEWRHPDDTAVDQFQMAMRHKMAESRIKGRGGWDDPNQCSVEYLAHLLIEHLSKGNSGTFVDIANFAMMLHQRGADPKMLANAANVARLEGWRLAQEQAVSCYKELDTEAFGVYPARVMQITAAFCEAIRALQQPAEWRE